MRRHEDGSATIETVFLGVLLLLPLVYAVITLARVQAGTFAASASARDAGRIFVTAPDSRAGAARARTAAQIAVEGYSVTSTGLDIECSARPCLSPGASIRVRSTVEVELPLVPRFLEGALPGRLAISAEHLEQVPQLREAR